MVRQSILVAAALVGLAGRPTAAQESGSFPSPALAFRNWLVVVRDRVVRSAVREPGTASGRVTMRFKLFDDGSVGEVAAAGATSARVAQLGIHAVRDAYPFPPIPEFTGRESIPFTVVLHFVGSSRRHRASHSRS